MLWRLLSVKARLETGKSAKTQPRKLLLRFPKFRLSTQLDKACRKLVEFLLWACLQGQTLTKMSCLGDASSLNFNPDYFLCLQHYTENLNLPRTLGQHFQAPQAPVLELSLPSRGASVSRQDFVSLSACFLSLNSVFSVPFELFMSNVF